MKKLKYLSPSSISCWLENREYFYVKYLADDAPDRDPQTQPMSVGSSFDAHVKSFIHNALFGKSDKFEFQTLFEAQVEPHNRDWALGAGKHAFDSYRYAGALSDLMLMLRDAEGEPQFEFTVQGVVEHVRDGFVVNVGGVNLLGKPDAYFTSKCGNKIILDWKVNGFCSKAGHSPKPGYIIIRDGNQQNSRGTNKPHKDCIIQRLSDSVHINCNTTMDVVEQDWARQISIYGWLLGNTVGSDFIAAIDQLVCKPSEGMYPTIRVAEHRTFISKEFQFDTMKVACDIWETCKTDHIFRDLSHEDSIKRQQTLDKQAQTLRSDPALLALLK